MSMDTDLTDFFTEVKKHASVKTNYAAVCRINRSKVALNNYLDNKSSRKNMRTVGHWVFGFCPTLSFYVEDIHKERHTLPLFIERGSFTNYDYSKFGEFLLGLIHSHRISLDDLADLSGIPKQRLKNLRRNNVCLSDTLIDILMTLYPDGFSFGYIIRGKDVPLYDSVK